MWPRMDFPDLQWLYCTWTTGLMAAQLKFPELRYIGCPLLGGSECTACMAGSISGTGFVRCTEVAHSSKSLLLELSLYNVYGGTSVRSFASSTCKLTTLTMRNLRALRYFWWHNIYNDPYVSCTTCSSWQVVHNWIFVLTKLRDSTTKRREIGQLDIPKQS